MEVNKSLSERYSGWMYEHLGVKRSLDYVWTFVVCTISAFLFCFGFKALMTTDLGDKLVSGGCSGISQCIILGMELFGMKVDENIAYGILYFVINIPIFFLAWFGIGKRFAIFTFINVVEVSLFSNLLANADWINNVTIFVNDNGGMLGRALFAGVFTGLSSALAFRVDISAGGIDVVAYYVALKKSTLVGKYQVVLNAMIVVVFTLESAGKLGFGSSGMLAIALMLYSFLYMFTVMLVVDFINLRNKKFEIKVITDNKNLSNVIIANVPHGATIVQGEGAYSGKARFIITTVISSYEVNGLVKILRREDPASFVQVTELKQVYGKFFVPRIR